MQFYAMVLSSNQGLMLLKVQIEIRDEDTQINIRTLVNTELHTDHLILAAI